MSELRNVTEACSWAKLSTGKTEPFSGRHSIDRAVVHNGILTDVKEATEGKQEEAALVKRDVIGVSRIARPRELYCHITTRY